MDENIWEMQNVTAKAYSRVLLSNIDLAFRAGELVAVLGPNGAGKSTLLNVMSGDRAYTANCLNFNGAPLDDWSINTRAKHIAVMRQHSAIDFPITALEVVLLGRFPHHQGHERPFDIQIAFASLSQMDAEHLAARLYNTLSGGEQQRVQAARALAQIAPASENTPSLIKSFLLDEPTASLDWRHADTLLAHLKKLAHQQNVCVVIAIHDINLAARYADRLLFIRDARIHTFGPPSSTLTVENLSAVFDLNATIISHPHDGIPYVVPLNSSKI